MDYFNAVRLQEIVPCAHLKEGPQKLHRGERVKSQLSLCRKVRGLEEQIFFFRTFYQNERPCRHSLDKRHFLYRSVLGYSVVQFQKNPYPTQGRATQNCDEVLMLGLQTFQRETCMQVHWNFQMGRQATYFKRKPSVSCGQPQIFSQTTHSFTFKRII